MQTRKFDELISYFNRKVSSMDIDQKCKMELLGMITAIGLAHEKEMPHWVLCSERLPEADGDYLVLYCTHSKYKPYVCDVIPFANDLYQIDEYDFNDKKGQKGWFYCDHEYGYCEDNSVYAWMPLPEPCRAERRTDEPDKQAD